MTTVTRNSRLGCLRRALVNHLNCHIILSTFHHSLTTHSPHCSNRVQGVYISSSPHPQRLQILYLDPARDSWLSPRELCNSCAGPAASACIIAPSLRLDRHPTDHGNRSVYHAILSLPFVLPITNLQPPVRICVCGDEGTGKSSLIASLVKDVFVSNKIQVSAAQLT